MLSPSDDSDIYSHVDMYSQENGESLVKPSDIKNAKMHQGKAPFLNIVQTFCFMDVLTSLLQKTCKLLLCVKFVIVATC